MVNIQNLIAEGCKGTNCPTCPLRTNTKLDRIKTIELCHTLHNLMKEDSS